MAHHLTKEERNRIAQWHHQGYPQTYIAVCLGRCPSTICHELNRNRTGPVYFPAQAHEIARRRRQRPITEAR